MEEYLILYMGGSYQFTVQDAAPGNFQVLADPATIPLNNQIVALVNQIKGAGIQWIMNYMNQQSENYRAAFQGKHGTDFQNADQIIAVTITPREDRYGFNTASGFMANASLVDQADTGWGRRMKESKLVMYYNSPNDPSYTVIPV
jgi:hypothetical protein